MVGHKRTKGKTGILYLVTTLVMLIMTFPFVYLVLHSFAAWDQVDRQIIPTTFSLRSWTWLFGGSATSADVPWLGAFMNTTIVATIATFLMMVFALMVGYALAKIEFKGKKLVNNFILFQMFFPAIILLIPQFLMVTKVGLLDSYAGMIIPTAISLWAIFMYTNFFKAIPDTLIEAAKLDGATEMQVLFKVVLPMSKSITTVIFLFLFTDRWTNLLWDMIVSKSDATTTLNVLISQMFGPYGTYPGPMYAASVLLTLPLIVLFLIFSKRFQDGMQFTLK
jgi:multiple sugar transport system permease protein